MVTFSYNSDYWYLLQMKHRRIFSGTKKIPINFFAYIRHCNSSKTKYNVVFLSWLLGSSNEPSSALVCISLPSLLEVSFLGADCLHVVDIFPFGIRNISFTRGLTCAQAILDTKFSAFF